MNYRIILKVIGRLLGVEAALLIIPFILSFIFKEGIYLAYLIPILGLTILSVGLSNVKLTRKNYYSKEGMIIVGLSWILLSLFGSIPFMLSGVLPNFFDAFFETVSGFTTTGSSVIKDVEVVYKSLLFWRSLTVWVGGMGVLAFVIAILPHTDARSMYIMKAESPGPQVGKLVSKIRLSAMILYIIYLALTLMLIILLAFKIPLFDSICYSLSAAGTGGFAIHNQSLAFYNSVYVEVVVSVFLILFGTNFSIFYLLLIRHFTQALKNEELRVYLSIIVVAIILISINTISVYETFGKSLRYALFQVASIITTTGFSTTDYNLWPSFAKWILIILMFTGASAGSTSGGIKISRIVLYFKSIMREIKYSIHPKQVAVITMDNKPIDDSTKKGVAAFLTTYMFILVLGVLIISLDGLDLITNFTAVLASISNVGPGLSMVGPLGNYAIFSNFSKLVLSLIMLIGRLELFPILVLFSPKLWFKN